MTRASGSLSGLAHGDARGATTSGDSASIAGLAGAFAGATHGLDAWPEQWAGRIGHGGEPAAFGRRWDR
ncbi:hypothetical protein ACQPYE_08925 [Actinosynnema sp. CA-299493]